MSKKIKSGNGKIESLKNRESSLLQFKHPSQNAIINSEEEYFKIYFDALDNPDKFWENAAKQLEWTKDWKKVKIGKGNSAKWFEGGKLNISYNCLDRHLTSGKKNKAALIWESESGKNWILTYQKLYSEVCKLANVLIENGIQKGDQVSIFMGVIPELVISILACIRIGAVPLILFSGFGHTALKKRLILNNSKIIITADGFYRKGTVVNLKKILDKALDGELPFEKVFVFKRVKTLETPMQAGRDFRISELLKNVTDNCEAVAVESNHPLFSLIVADEMGKLKKLSYHSAGFSVQTCISAKWIFNIEDDDIFWSTSDPSWISGLAYGVIAPLLLGITAFIFEGIPIYPEPDRYWNLIDKNKITKLFTNPTTVRGIRKLGDDYLNAKDLSSLKIIALKGENINCDDWMWFFEKVGRKKIPLLNTYLQSEAGTIICSPFPYAGKINNEFITTPFPGFDIDVVKINGSTVSENDAGFLVVKNNWPAESDETFNGDSIKNLLSRRIIKGVYFTGDAAIKKPNGGFKLLGRVDKVLKSAGHRICVSEIEDILNEHPKVTASIVLQKPDKVIGNSIVALVELKDKKDETTLLKEELRNLVGDAIGLIAKPDELIFAEQLTEETRGKINYAVVSKEFLKIESEETTESEEQQILNELKNIYWGKADSLFKDQ